MSLRMPCQASAFGVGETTKGLGFCLFVLLMVNASTVRAFDYEGARLLALGGAQRALTTGNDSIYINPAGIALANVYSLEVGYLDDFGGADRRLNASIVDSQAGRVAGGVSYTHGKLRPLLATSPDERVRGHRIEGVLATRLSDSSAIGANLRYLTVDRRDGETEVNGGDYNKLTFDVGAQWRLSEEWSVGAAGYNLTRPDRAEMPLSWGAGLGYQKNSLSFEGDVRYNLDEGNPTFSGGVGYVLAAKYPVRGGVAYDRDTKATIFSFGLGLVYDSFAVDIGYKQRVDGNKTALHGAERVFAVALRAVVP